MAKFVAKKRFGQNFLQDSHVLTKIVNIIDPKFSDNIVEIGPGLGALTLLLLKYVNLLEVIEIDREIIEVLRQRTIDYKDKLIIHNKDALKFDYRHNSQSIRLVGNLPYNISTQLLFYLSKFDNICDMYFMLQKEVVDRICAGPNTRDYGRLTVMLQLKYMCTKMFEVANTCFSPRPRVTSAIVQLKPLDIVMRRKVDEKILNLLVTTAFSMRRKTILNSLKSFIANTAIFEALGIDASKRAENLSIDEFVLLANYVSNNIKQSTNQIQ